MTAAAKPANGRANGGSGAKKAEAEQPAEQQAADPLAAQRFPVDSFRDAAPHLRRPFTPQAVKFKVQSTWPKDNPTGALIVFYIDARLVIERLNLVCPHLWHEGGRDPVNEPPYQQVAGGLLCRLTVDGITRADVGEGQVKGLVSDALKRAAVHFGIGVSLYATPKTILNLDAQGLLKAERTNKGPTLELTPKGERHCRDLYGKWLSEHGVQAFGEPLDHGDVEDHQGDAEVDAPEQEEAPPPARQRRQQQEQQAAPEPTGPSPDEQLAELLAAEHPLQKKRRAANAGMERLGAGPGQRLKELQTAGDERAIDALIVRISNALDQSAGGGQQ